MSAAASATDRARTPGAAEAPRLVSVQNLKTYFPVVGGVFRKTVGYVKAVNDVSLDIDRGEVLSVVGESGCGKSTLGFSLLGLVPPTEGAIVLDGRKINIRNPAAWNPY